MLLSRHWFDREPGAVTSVACITLAVSAMLAVTGCSPTIIGESRVVR